MDPLKKREIFVIFAFMLIHIFLTNVNGVDKKKRLRIEREIIKEKIDDEINEKDPSKWWRGQQMMSEKGHPHVGAQHPNGTLGMIVDPSIERLGSYVKKEEFICHDGPGIEDKKGYRVLQIIRNGIIKSRNEIEIAKNVSYHLEVFNSTNEIEVAKNVSYHSEVSNSTDEIEEPELFKRNRTRLLCLVYTHYSNHTRHRNLRSISDTWGRQCDGFIAASNYTDHSIGAIDLKHAGEEAYGNMWQKIRSMWSYAYDNYLDEYDYFYICGDDTYVAVDNFRAYLDGFEIERLENGFIDSITKRYLHYDIYANLIKKWKKLRPVPIVLGIPMMWKDMPFASGGSGYALNNAALKVLVEDGIPKFLPNQTDSREDVFVASTFAEMGIFVANTFDLKGGARFFGSALTSYEILCEQKQTVLRYDFLKEIFKLQSDVPKFSEQQISFHLKDDKERLEANGYTVSDLMYRYQALLQGEFCPDLDLFRKKTKFSCSACRQK